MYVHNQSNGETSAVVRTERLHLGMMVSWAGLRIDRTEGLGYVRSEGGRDPAVDHSNKVLYPLALCILAQKAGHKSQRQTPDDIKPQVRVP